MKNVEFFDWKLNSGKPFSYMIQNYPDRNFLRIPDIHSALHLALILHGERTGVHRGEVIRSKEGEFYLTAPWEPHYTLSAAFQHKLILLNIDWDSLQNAFFTGKELLETLILLPPGERMKRLNLKLQNTGTGGELSKAVQLADGREKDLLLWNLIQKIFITALPEQEETIRSAGDYQRLLPALKGLSNRMSGVKEAAEKCHLSTGYFSILFKKQFGMSFGKYERNFRLNGAEAALRRGCTLKEAADYWDFCDKSHLARLLKKRV